MLRLLFSFGVLFLLFASPFARADVTVAESGGTRTYTFRIEGVTHVFTEMERDKYLRAELKGVAGYEGIVAGEGKPHLPVVRFFLDGEGEVQVSHGPAVTEMHLPAGVRVEPNHRMDHKGATDLVSALVLGPLYFLDQYFPLQDSEVTEVGTIGGKRRRLVTLYAYRYNPMRGLTRLISDFRVTYKRTDSDAVEEPVRQTLALVLGKDFATSAAAEKLAAHKRALGFEVRRLVAGTDFTDAASLRAKLRALYARTESSLRYALLVGDLTRVPSYPTERLSQEGEFDGEENDVGYTDHFYRSLDQENYEADLGAPDIGVGRLSARSEAELSTIVDNEVRYERGDFTDPSWLRYWSFIASNDSNPEHFLMAQEITDWIVDNYGSPRGYLGNFPTAGVKGGDRLYAIGEQATGKDVLAQLTQGRGLVLYAGHGWSGGWVGPEVKSSDLSALTHPEALPVVLSHACDTAEFGGGDSFAEAWQRHPHGSILFWGSYRPTYWDRADVLLEERMFDAVFQQHRREIGDFTSYSLADYWRYYGGGDLGKYYWETYVTFGDPSLEIRTSIPRRVEIFTRRYKKASHPILGVWVVSEKGRRLPRVRVGVTGPGRGAGLIAHTDDYGMATFELPAEMQGDLTVTTSGANTVLNQTVAVGP